MKASKQSVNSVAMRRLGVNEKSLLRFIVSVYNQFIPYHFVLLSLIPNLLYLLHVLFSRLLLSRHRVDASQPLILDEPQRQDYQ